MAITLSTNPNFAISRDGTSWLNFTINPETYDVQPAEAPFERADGTAQITLYAKIVVGWKVMLMSEFQLLQALYQVTNQVVYLNYMSFEATSVSDATPKYYYAPATMRLPPTGNVNGVVVENVSAEFDYVEWHGYVP